MIQYDLNDNKFNVKWIKNSQTIFKTVSRRIYQETYNLRDTRIFKKSRRILFSNEMKMKEKGGRKNWNNNNRGWRFAKQGSQNRDSTKLEKSWSQVCNTGLAWRADKRRTTRRHPIRCLPCFIRYLRTTVYVSTAYSITRQHRLIK